ncbi:MAG TPA: glucose-1-phosphate cytidylyltransferase [Devosiaceae bacterium]|nr:glucose-1-phosphate cytidylyltransferase [Devosiaceae bacterium]
MNYSNVPVFILAGGLGTRLKEYTEFRPKPMVEVGGRPMLWHIMRWYGHFGFKRFIICAGFKSEVIKDYFLNYGAMNSDFTVNLASRDTTYHSAHHEEDWEVTIAYTGETTMTGARIGIAADKYLGNAEYFAVTYGDGLTDANLIREFEFHRSHGKIGTVLAINPPSRFGDLVTEGELVTDFAEKPELSTTWINGGYFFFRREFLNYLSHDESLTLEKQPLTRLARDHELAIWRHKRFWACMDTQRDRDELDGMWRSGKAPWATSAVEEHA